MTKRQIIISDDVDQGRQWFKADAEMLHDASTEILFPGRIVQVVLYRIMVLNKSRDINGSS